MTTATPTRRRTSRPRTQSDLAPVPNSEGGVGSAHDTSSEDGQTTNRRIRVHLYPEFRGEDQGDGGVRRVVEAQIKYLPAEGIEIVSDPVDADVIACHIQAPASYLVRFPNKPFVGHTHGLYWAEYSWPDWALKANAGVMELIRASEATTTPSEWVSATVRRHTSRDVTTIHHGVDCEEWTPPANKPEVQYVLWNKTRPDPVCDPEPVNLVASVMPDVQFVSTFGDEARNIAITGRLPYENAKKLIQHAAIYLCTSKETFGIGTLEAMACGVPVVGFRWGGQREIVREGVDGYLVAPDDIDALQAAIRKALANREELGRNARERAEYFTWQKAAKAYADLYRRVVANTAIHEASLAPRTTIVVTNHDLHEYLSDCLQSVQDQDDKDWECIVVDDASSSPLGLQIANDFAEIDKRFRVIDNETNVYLAEARNIAIRQAKGKYILPLDADDMLTPSTVGVLAEALDRDKLIHIAYGNVKFVNENGTTPTVYEGHESTPGFSSWPMQFSFEQQVRQRNLLPYCSMYRRDVWRLTGGYSPRCRTAEDATFWTRASSYGFAPKMVTREATLVYRNRPHSMSREQGTVNWIKWFPWARDSEITPAGACTPTQLPVSALDEIAISVIIPVGPDHTTLVKDAVDSLDAQFFRDWECIVINDSGEPLPELPAWVRVLETSDAYDAMPKGVAPARNWGIQNSIAPLFLPLDADDYLQPNALQIMLDVYRDVRQIVYTDFWEDPDVPGRFKPYALQDYAPERLTHGVLHCVTALTPVSAWRKVGGYDETLPGWEDWDFQIKCADAGICSRRIAAPLWTYRKHTGKRRNENVTAFERSKQGILAKWARLWELGGAALAACAACGARQTIVPPGMMSMAKSNGGAPPSTDEEIVYVTYTGAKQGGIPFKGVSGAFYTFSAGEERYVLKRDVHVFENRKDFVITSKAPAPATEQLGDRQPVLVADGKPS